MNLPGKRLLLGTAIATAALGVGGIAYAAGNDPGPEQGYVTIEDGATTPGADPSTGPSTGQGQSGTQRDGRDCPEKNGSGTEQGQGSQGSTPQTQPEQSQADPQSNA